VYSSAVTPDNPELVEARRAGVPIIPRGEMLAELLRLKYAVTVAGAHGKTSTTSLIASVMAEGGLDPTVIVGGRVRALSSKRAWAAAVVAGGRDDGKFVNLPRRSRSSRTSTSSTWTSTRTSTPSRKHSSSMRIVFRFTAP
jgi:UDP-N-acetylmuramate--alanine ligase